jgi:uncharacterized protein YdiU (UPF0061 family)
MLREAIMGEALAGLGIPTSRALAVVATGEPVYRERVLPGAVLTRIAASHLRIGTFEFFTAHGSVDQLQQLVDYAITRHYPDLTEASDRYLAFLAVVADRQAALIAQWNQPLIAQWNLARLAEALLWLPSCTPQPLGWRNGTVAPWLNGVMDQPVGRSWRIGWPPSIRWSLRATKRSSAC